MDNHLKLNACMLAPAPPLTGAPNDGRNMSEWAPLPQVDQNHDLGRKYSCCDLIVGKVALYLGKWWLDETGESRLGLRVTRQRVHHRGRSQVARLKDNARLRIRIVT